PVRPAAVELLHGGPDLQPDLEPGYEHAAAAVRPEHALGPADRPALARPDDSRRRLHGGRPAVPRPDHRLPAGRRPAGAGPPRTPRAPTPPTPGGAWAPRSHGGSPQTGQTTARACSPCRRRTRPSKTS